MGAETNTDYAYWAKSLLTAQQRHGGMATCPPSKAHVMHNARSASDWQLYASCKHLACQHPEGKATSLQLEGLITCGAKMRTNSPLFSISVTTPWSFHTKRSLNQPNNSSSVFSEAAKKACNQKMHVCFSSNVTKNVRTQVSEATHASKPKT